MLLLNLLNKICDLTSFCNSKNGIQWSIPLSSYSPKVCKYYKTGEKERAWLAIPQWNQTCTHLQPAKQIRKKKVQIPIQMCAFLTPPVSPLIYLIYQLYKSSLPPLHSLGSMCPSLWQPLYKHLICLSLSARCSIGRSSLKPIFWACTQEAEHHWRRNSTIILTGLTLGLWPGNSNQCSTLANSPALLPQ